MLWLRGSRRLWPITSAAAAGIAGDAFLPSRGGLFRIRRCSLGGSLASCGTGIGGAGGVSSGGVSGAIGFDGGTHGCAINDSYCNSL